jgi:pimeloyl-ACP methyl ester carboxylesterase
MEQFTRAGLTFDVLDSGPPDGPVVILLHGWPQFSTCWNDVIPALTAQGLRCLAPDQRGYSPQARPEGRRAYVGSELSADVLALVEASGADRVHLVGHDWGAAAAWAFAARYPERVASLSALSVPHPAAMVRAVATSRQFLASWYMYLFQLPWLPELILMGRDGRHPRGLLRFLRSGGQSAEAAERDAAAMVSTGAMGYALNWYRAMPFANQRTTKSQVQVPTMYVWSDGDKAILRKTAEACGDWVTGPYRFEVLKEVSHWMPDEAPEAVANLLLKQFAAYPI